MIRYPITEAELIDRIDTHSPNWRKNAKRRTTRLVKAGTYNEKSDIWGDIKRVYMDLQGSKCGYCERLLENSKYAPIEHDIEHFRPKAGIEAYPPTGAGKDERDQLQYSFATGGSWATGYFQLAYHPLNYLTACKTCNSTLKASYFPISGNRVSGASHPSQFVGEEHLLLYPIGDLDPNPEQLISFDGILATPTVKTGPNYERAQFIIDFFQLNKREGLRRERAEIIAALSSALYTSQNADDDNPHKGVATRQINAQLSWQSSHTNCSRCFVRLYLDSTTHHKALQIAEAASKLLPQ